MKRREFITLLGSAAATLPLAARAQQPAKLPTIGLLGAGAPPSPSNAAFVQRLRELGWIEGRTVVVEYRWAAVPRERFAEAAAELIRLKVDVIVTNGNGVLAAKQATSVIPIVFALSGDPVAEGLVASLARPGGNVTGLSNQSIDLVGKRVELLREAVPGLRRLAILAPADDPRRVLDMRDVQAAARTLGLEAATFEIRRAEDLVPAFDALKGRADALDVFGGGLTFTNRVRINALALAAQLPTIFTMREFLEGGGLMSYGANFPDRYRRAAEVVDKILRGTKPADIPVEQPTTFEFVINLKTAKALGLDIPLKLHAFATNVIE